jgi:Deoxycytidylate deaminase
MKEYKEAVECIYSENENLIILGLTGRTGSGCSTVANILSTKEYPNLDINFEDDQFSKTERYKQNIITDYMKSSRWFPFTVIELSSVILSCVFEKHSKNEFKSDLLIKYLVDLQNNQEGANFRIDSFNQLKLELEGMEYIFKEVQEHPIDQLNELFQKKTDVTNSEQIKKMKDYYNFYIDKLKIFKKRFRETLSKYTCFEEKKSKMQDDLPVKYHLYTYLLQKFGNNVRASGNPYDSRFKQDAYLDFSKRIELFIELIRYYDSAILNKKTRICIETIRNPFEAYYLKERYRAFWLMSINSENNERIERLPHLDKDELKSLDNVEYPQSLKDEEIFYHQNIGTCLEVADIHILNKQARNLKYFFLTSQLLKYVALMLHPGLITPTSIERCMQLAYNAKYNSGCLSRQVGAIVTGTDFSVKSVGWNDVPKGQLPCNLRDVHEYCNSKNSERYSDYEITDENFEKALKSIDKKLDYSKLCGRHFPYCFKDIHNGIKDDKNQVYTRALHAEENAFLQISKYGGQGVEDGFLFTTASPCELCAKKAYQLGINEIYYIDPYPGISQNHILSFGKEGNPKMKLFYGAIGEAYISLYKPKLPYKDELSLLSGIKPKKIANNKENMSAPQPGSKDMHYKNMEITMEFSSRENIQSTREVEFQILNGSYEFLERGITWTGSSYDGTEIISPKEIYNIEELSEDSSPYKYKYKIIFDSEKKKGDNVSYSICTNVKDESHLMHPYFAHLVKSPIDNMIIKLVIPKKFDFIENPKAVRYADLKMETEYNGNDSLQIKEEDNKIIYFLEVKKPLLFYSYSIEWEWKKLEVKREV